MPSRRTRPEEELDRADSCSPPSRQPRRKGPGAKTWLIVSSSGHSYHAVFGRHSIMRRAGLPARDLRALDPILSYPSTILGREKAIVVNLEHIKAIITANEVLVLNPKDPMVVPFAHDLEFHVSNFCRTLQTETQSGDNDIGVTNRASCNSPSSFVHHQPASPSSVDVSQQFPIASNNFSITHETEDDSPRPTLNVPKDGSPNLLPFEFRVLEVCLESTCKCLESETSMLEQEAYPVLDELTSKISTLNLEHVRQIKSRLVAMSGRVQKVRDELEHLLDDDMDMADMYLTRKLNQQLEEETSSRNESDNEPFKVGAERYDGSGSKAKSTIESLSGPKPDIQELEMLLEAYFTQIGGTLNKLSTLREYVDDTEDYINIILDDKQNQLLQMGVMLSAAILIINAAIVVMGVMGMNIHISLFKTGQEQFLETVIGTLVGSLVLYFIAIGWGKRKGLLG